MSNINIAIDGPAGAGKSTIARLVAKKLNYIYVDTGAMYRAMALCCIRAGFTADEKEKIEACCSDCTVDIEYVDGEQNVLLNGENVGAFIRTEEVSQMTSAISVYPKVREKLLDLQRNVARYWIICSSRCRFKDLLNSFCCYKSKEKIFRADGEGT